VKKEKLFHPASRKAGQLARHALCKGKLGNLATKRNQKHHSLGVSLCQLKGQRLTIIPVLAILRTVAVNFATPKVRQ
jgi:hypothetical protein